MNDTLNPRPVTDSPAHDCDSRGAEPVPCACPESFERLTVLARLLAYPHGGPRAGAGAHDESPAALARRHAAASAEPDAWRLFADEADLLGQAGLEEIYERTFDLSPVVAPYLSVHLWGEESFQRAMLMTGLRAAYGRIGVSDGTELPDHLALVLESGPRLPGPEWADLAIYAVLPAFRLMSEALAPSRSPYRHLLPAAIAEVAATVGLTVPEALELPTPTQRPGCTTTGAGPGQSPTGGCGTRPCNTLGGP